MDVLVIGGTRYFGKVIVRRLLERGDAVTVYSRGSSRPDFWSDVAHIQGDRTDYDGFDRNLRNRTFDAVVDNLAFKLEDAQAAVKALRGRVGKYLVASTVSIYGGLGHALEWHPKADAGRPRHLSEFVDLEANCPLREEVVDLTGVSWSYDPDISEYAQGKRQIERYLQETPDFPSVVLRVPATVGPEDRSLRFWWYMERVQDGREIVMRDGGSNVFRNGYRDDIARAFIDAMDSPHTANRIYNVAQAEVITLRRLLEVIAEKAGCALNTVSVPGDAAEALSRLPWESWRFDPFSRPPNYVMSIEKARRDFRLHSTPLEEWVGTTVEWYREHHDGSHSFSYESREEEVRFAQWWRREFGRFVETARVS